MCNVLQFIVFPFVLFLLASALSVLRFTDSDYPFGIIKLFLWLSFTPKTLNCLALQSFDFERTWWTFSGEASRALS